MTDETLDALAQALASDPPRPVDPDVLAAADQGELAAALRRAVAHLPATEQRTRLAAAFKAMTPVGNDLEVEIADPTSAAGIPLIAAGRPEPPLVSPSTARGLLALRPLTAVRAGALAGLLVVALIAGVLAGTITQDTTPEQVAVPGAAENPIPLLEPVAYGNEPPSEEAVAGMLPPDPAAQAQAIEEAAAADPEAFDDPGISARDAVYTPDPNGTDPSVSGYVDGPADRTGLTAEGDLIGEDEPPTLTIPPEDGAADAGGAESDPALVDLCSVDSPPEDCDGVGGTVTLAITQPFAFFEDPTVFTGWPACVSLGRDLEPDEFVIFLQTNNLGSFTARYRIAGSGSPYTEVSDDTPEIWGTTIEERPYATTCVVAERPSPDATTLDVDITGVGADDTGTIRFQGELDLPAREDVVAPEVAVRRDGRPDVTVDAISASVLEVTVPVGDNELAEVTLVPRDPDGSGGECAEPARNSVAEGEPIAVVTARPPGGITLMSDWVDRRFTVTAPEPGPYSVCVQWTDDFDPPTELERATIPVEIPRLTETTFLLVRYDQNPCLGSGCPSVPLHVRGTADLENGSACIGNLVEGRLSPAEPIELCTVDGQPGRVAFHTHGGFNRNGDRVRLDGEPSHYAASFDPTCAAVVCTVWYAVPVRAPGGFFEGNGGTVGKLIFGVRISGGSGVVIGEERPELIDDSEFEGPRLSWDQVSVRPDPDDPARGAIVRWEADRPVTLIARAEAAYDESCPLVTAESTEATTSGTLQLTGLCPGSTHYVSFELRSEDGSWTSYNVLRAPTRRGTDFVQRSALLDTEPLSVTYDFQLHFRELRSLTGDELTGLGIIPSRLELHLPGGPAVDYRQWFDGSAYMGLECADPSHFSQSGSGIPLALRGGTFRLGESFFEFHPYRPVQVGVFDSHSPRQRVCPTLFNQANHTRTDPMRSCPYIVRNLTPSRSSPSTSTATSDLIDHMLSGGEATFEATVPSGCATDFEVTLTVQMREV